MGRKNDSDTLTIQAAAMSNIGKVRQRNEDALALLPEQSMLVVSDGIGGHQAGEVASKIVVEILPKMIQKMLPSPPDASDEEISLVLRDAILDLSQKIFQQSAGQVGLAGMGATVVFAFIHREQAYIAHLGDSRAYIYRERKLHQITEDHSVVGILLRDGKITQEEAKDHPAKGALSRYVGMEQPIYPDIRIVELRDKDRLLLCTDGLTEFVTDEEIAGLLAKSRSHEQACKNLINAANANGGGDNITVIVAQFRDTQ